MSIKVIGAGFGRTGTMSTYIALTQLGFPCYHMYEVLKNKSNKSHIDFWNKVANDQDGQQHDWNEVFEKYTATVDNPGCCVWRELMVAYPDAKVLMTLHPRSPEAWYESTMNTIYQFNLRWQFKVMTLVPFFRKFSNMANKLIWERSHKSTMRDKKAAIARYHEHLEEVKAAVPPENLLIFTADQGWEPLCKFLGVEVPDGDFPRVNDRKEVLKELSQMTRGAYAIMVLGSLLLAGIGYGLFKLLF